MPENQNKLSSQGAVDEGEGSLQLPEIVNAVVERGGSPSDLQNNFNATFGLPAQEMSVEEEYLLLQTRSLIARFKDLRFDIERLYNTARDQQEQSTQPKTSSPKSDC